MKTKWTCSATINIIFSPYGDFEQECNCEFIAEVDEGDWAEGCASARCPKCGSVLWQDEEEVIVIAERICPLCHWEGAEEDCLDYKHPIGTFLCPQCYEITEKL